MTIQSIIREYQYNEATLECLLCDMEPAFEAMDGEMKDRDLNPSVMRNIGDKIKRLIQHLQALLSKAFSALHNTTTKILQTDHGFSDQFRRAVKKQKPLQAVKLITYDYQNGFLDQQLSRWDNVVQGLISGIKTDLRSESLLGDGTEMDMKTSDLTKTVLKKIGAPSDVTDMGLYFLYIKKTYRKGKVERLFKSSELRQYYNMTQSCGKLKSVIQAKNVFMSSNVNRMKANLAAIHDNKRISDGIRKRVLKQSGNVSSLLNMYTSFLKVYMQMKTEEILSYRAVCKKLLRF